ncbi:hypothetical protein ACLRDC_20390 [Gluconacetobacter sacchari]|uniref:hypothetical protein n=1 Tax=Gluconacetobacter sacchari TaxID=92759 RepID=UPI0039B5B5E7
MASGWLPLNLQGLVYECAIDVLVTSARAALDAMRASSAANTAALEAHRASGVFEGERDEHGMAICDRAELHEQEIAYIAEMANELRKAFVVAAYHHWEVSVLAWARRETPHDANLRNHAQSVAKAIEVGYPPDAELRQVSCLANLIKHDSDSARRALKKAAPKLYETMFENVTARPRWASAVEISDATLDWVFEVVRKSGPGVHTLPPPPPGAPASAPSAT